MIYGCEFAFGLKWLGALRKQAITLTNIDPYLGRHMESLSHNELTPIELKAEGQPMCYWSVFGDWFSVAFFIVYHQTSNISHTKSQNLNVSRLVLQLSLPNPLKPGVKSRMKMSFGAAPTDNVQTKSEWSTILLPTTVSLILEVWWYIYIERGYGLKQYLKFPQVPILVTSVPVGVLAPNSTWSFQQKKCML